MVEEPADPNELTGVVLDWFRLLANGRWDEACGRLDEPNTYGISWTPSTIREAVELSLGTGHTFSDPASIARVLPASVGEYDDRSGYYVEHYVPLDGAWSDLVAQFQFLRRPGGLAVVLHDQHVM